MPARNRARQIEKRPHRNDAAFSISEREGANLRNSNPTLWDWQERTRRSNLRQTPPRFVITIKMPSGTGQVRRGYSGHTDFARRTGWPSRPTL